MTLSVASYNLGPGKKKVGDLEVLAGVAQVVATQEAGDQGDQLHFFAARTPGWDVFRSTAKAGMGAVAFVADTRFLTGAQLHMHLAVPARWVGPKGAGPTTAKAKYIARLSGVVDGQPVHILDTHLIPSWTKSKKALGEKEWAARRAHVRAHVAAIVEVAASLEGTVLLAADLNGPPSHALLKPLHAAGLVGWSSTPTLKRRSVDQVLVHGAAVASTRVVGGLTSDHKARVTAITLPVPAPPKETDVSYYLAPSLKALTVEVAAAWPGVRWPTVGIGDGWVGDTSHAARKSDHNPDWSAGGVVRAVDIGIEGRDAQRLLAAAIGDPRVWYAIHKGRIYSRTYGWESRAYTGHPHDHHIHISIRHARDAETLTATWLSAATGPTEPQPTTPPPEDDMALDDKLWPNDDDSPTVRDVLRAQHKARARLDARTKTLLEQQIDPQAIATAVVALLPAGALDEATVVAGVKRALAELVNER